MASVGVPVIVPVLVLKNKPAGKVLSIEYDATKPVTVGVNVLIDLPVM
jgi:hypothetical protein